MAYHPPPTWLTPLPILATPYVLSVPKYAPQPELPFSYTEHWVLPTFPVIYAFASSEQLDLRWSDATSDVSGYPEETLFSPADSIAL